MAVAIAMTAACCGRPRLTETSEMTCALGTWGLARPSALLLAGTLGQPVSGRPVREAAVPEIVPDASAASATPAASRNGATSTAADRTASRRPLLTAAPWQAGRRNAGGG